MADDFSPECNDEYDIYGKTPPRTKLLRKHRDRRQKEKVGYPSGKTKMKASIGRRNTISTLYDDLISRSENTDSDHGGSPSLKRSSKRQMKLLRGSERDLKLDIASAQAMQHEMNGFERPRTPQPKYHIESSKRFMCLVGRTMVCPRNRYSCDSKLPDQKFSLDEEEQQTEDEALCSRIEFHQTLCLLVRMGGADKNCQDRNPKRILSREENHWQNELKDLIWLELRAFLEDRTPMEEDEYLCKARKDVDELLNDIMNYRFQKHLKPITAENQIEECGGCTSMYCVSCVEAQNEALRQIDELSARLEKAEALFPSSKAFSELYPLYCSPEFYARVKTISLWVNMVRQHRIKLMLLGRFLFLLDTKSCIWCVPTEKTGGSDFASSPSDSNNSSSSNEFFNEVNKCMDFYNVNFLTHLMNITEAKDSSSPYRRYIENILKTKGVDKSLSFLNKLHTHVLIKAQLTLEKPKDYGIFKRNEFDLEEDELRRYGAWSPEAKAINLPSYRASFLFLAAVPLDVIHEFLQLRLEQRPPNPSLLSIRQLIRELKDGMKLAITQRIRTEKYIKVALEGTNCTGECYTEKLKSYDQCLKNIFAYYLDYLEKWATFEHERFHKNKLEEEWNYCRKIVENIPDGLKMLDKKFCEIFTAIFKSIRERLLTNVEILTGSIQEEDDVKYSIFGICRELQTVINDEREMSIKAISFFKTVIRQTTYEDPNRNLKEAIVALKCSIPKVIEKIQLLFAQVEEMDGEKFDKLTALARVREILMQIYKFGFEFYREMDMAVPSERRGKLVRTMLRFANLWMKFVVEKCDRGRGLRPRWAYQGLEFLLTVCDPKNTKFLSDEEFEELKKNMDHCISHVIGTTAPSTPESGFYSASPRSSGRSRGSSPSPRPTYKSQRSAGKRTSEDKIPSPVTADVLDSFEFVGKRREEIQCESVVKINLPPANRNERTLEAMEILENELDDRLRKQALIGKVIESSGKCSRSRIRQRYVDFTWQRGIKIGQGRFGKVYTAVNNKTGEMMAVKEISLQYNDNATIKRVAEEMKILEGIIHKNLVKYYGIEVHREEMLLFMEYCQEGTLESLILMTVDGLPEVLVRRYTFQLVSGVECLHDHGIVHRDIKTANIFLTDEGNCLKIGDFGCAAKIKFNTTMPGELKGFVGTQAYMAPEVFTKNMSEGHGRAADIWSVGCCVVEMASGKRPWSQYDSNYQIMFKVGMGESPDPPDNLIDEGLDFLELCFKFDPKDRATAHELLAHNFVNVGDDF